MNSRTNPILDQFRRDSSYFYLEGEKYVDWWLRDQGATAREAVHALKVLGKRDRIYDLIVYVGLNDDE